MKKEIWKDIPSFEGFYQVSSLSRFRSVERLIDYKDGRKPRLWPERMLKGFIGTSGYWQADLKKSGVVTKIIQHRIIALVFIPNPDNKGYINHKDGNKLNNDISNLEWCDNGENVRHSFAIGKHSGIGATHYKARRITDGKNEFGTLQEAGDFYGLSKKVIFDIISGRVKNRLGIKYI